MVHIFSNFQGTFNVSQRNINPLPLWKNSLVFNNSQEYITMPKQTNKQKNYKSTLEYTQLNIWHQLIYNSKETASKNSANCATTKK